MQLYLDKLMDFLGKTMEKLLSENSSKGQRKGE